MKKERKPSVAILVLSCDKYQDLWKPFFHQFWIHWPNCPYTIYLGSNTKTYEDKRVETVLSGPDKDWSSSLLSILKQILEEHLFIWLDDKFLLSQTNIENWERCWNLLRKKAYHIHMSELPRADGRSSEGIFGLYEKGAPYRVNVLGFWRKSYLEQVLLPGESPWQFEIMGSYRSSFDDGFYCTFEPVFQNLHVVEKGMIIRESAEYCKRHNIPLSVKVRTKLHREHQIRSIAQKYFFNAASLLPWKYRVRAMNMLRKLLISY